MTARDDALQLISQEVGVDLASIIATEARTYKEALDPTVEHKAKKDPVPADEEEELDEDGNPIKKDKPEDKPKVDPKKKDEMKKDVEAETEPITELKEVPVADVVPEPAPEQPITPELVKQLVKAFGETYGMNELAGHITQQNEMLVGLKAQLDVANTKIAELEKGTEEKVAESIAILPRFPWMQSFQPSTAKETELSNDPSDQALKASVPTNSPIASLVKNM